MRRTRFCSVLWLAAFVAALVLSTAWQAATTAVAAEPQASPQAIARVMLVQDRNTQRLMVIKGVVGTATGLTAEGQPTVKVFTAQAGVAGIPPALEGVPVEVVVTGPLSALKGPPPGKGGGGGGKVDPTSRFPRPVPIGVSTGNANECAAGTIACRVKDGTNVYALSNNHVYARPNVAALGEEILQPGRYDTSCVYDQANVIGTLYSYAPITFTTTASNTIDAAIALSSTTNLGNATPSNGYGTPSSATVAAQLNQPVQKYGRTTSLTKGTVIGINSTVFVGYGSKGTARFIDQIVVGANRGAFIKSGDSGSLSVTDDNNKNPVGLLFAGDSSGKYGIANPIGPVLAFFGVAIDDQ